MNIILIMLDVGLLGFLTWLITLIPAPPPFKQVVVALSILLLVLYLLSAFGVISIGITVPIIGGGRAR